MRRHFKDWLKDQNIKYTFHNYKFYHEGLIDFYKSCDKSIRNEKISTLELAPILSNNKIAFIQEKVNNDEATYEESVSLTKTRDVSKFIDLNVDVVLLNKYQNNRTHINNLHAEKEDHILHNYKVDSKRFVDVYHSDPVFDKKLAISELCNLLGIQKTYLPNDIPKDKFVDLDFVSNIYYLVYFDTGQLQRKPDEPKREGYQISDRTEKVAFMCSRAFGLNVNSVKSVKGVMGIIKRTLELWSSATLIEGIKQKEQMNKKRITYTPYLITTSRSLINIMLMLKSYQQLEDDYIKSLFEIDKSSKPNTSKHLILK